MRCPFCGAMENKVIDSRLAGEGAQIRRRRECVSCGERYTTYETAELSLPRVIKSNGSRESFSEEKLRSGLLRALEKRPVETDSIENAIGHVKHRLLVAGDREIPSRQIGEWVMDELRKLDHVAYVRFASVYRSFQDVDEFREVIERLENEPTPEEFRDQIPLLDEHEHNKRR